MPVFMTELRFHTIHQEITFLELTWSTCYFQNETTCQKLKESPLILQKMQCNYYVLTNQKVIVHTICFLALKGDQGDMMLCHKDTESTTEGGQARMIASRPIRFQQSSQ